MLAKDEARGARAGAAGIVGLIAWLALVAMPAASPAPGPGGPFAGVKHDTKAPNEIASDSLEVHQAQGKAVFAGEVVAEQGTLTLTADELVVTYETGEAGDETGEIQHMRAEGNVFLSNGSETAEGAWAEYDVAGGTLHMGGDVLVTQGENAVTGESLVINLDAGTGRVEGRGDGRVKSVFVPARAEDTE